MKTPITLARLKTHLTYSWWKYLLAVAICALGMNLFFSVTRAQAPEDQKIEWVIYGDVYNTGVFSGWLETQRVEINELLDRQAESGEDFPLAGCPKQADFTCSNISLSSDSSGAQALLVRVGVAGDGDLLIMPRETFQSYAESGLFVDLDTLAGVPEAIAGQGIRNETGRWKGPDGEQHTYGIPVSQMPVLNSWFLPGEDYILSVRSSNHNEAVTAEMLIRVLRDWTQGSALDYGTYLEQTSAN